MIFECGGCGCIWTRARTLRTVIRGAVPRQICPDCVKEPVNPRGK